MEKENPCLIQTCAPPPAASAIILPMKKMERSKKNYITPQLAECLTTLLNFLQIQPFLIISKKIVKGRKMKKIQLNNRPKIKTKMSSHISLKTLRLPQLRSQRYCPTNSLSKESARPQFATSVKPSANTR